MYFVKATATRPIPDPTSNTLSLGRSPPSSIKRSRRSWPTLVKSPPPTKIMSFGGLRLSIPSIELAFNSSFLPETSHGSHAAILYPASAPRSHAFRCQSSRQAGPATTTAFQSLPSGLVVRSEHFHNRTILAFSPSGKLLPRFSLSPAVWVSATDEDAETA